MDGMGYKYLQGVILSIHIIAHFRRKSFIGFLGGWLWVIGRCFCGVRF